MSSFLLGGRLGDLIHMLYVVKNTQGKHDLFITDRRDLHSDGFIYSLDKTIEELKPVLLQQEYVNSIQAYKDEEVINLNLWRRYAYSDSWTNLLSKTFNVPVNNEPWLKIKNSTGNELPKVIHCSIPEARRGDWSKVDLSGDTVFIGSGIEYEKFGFETTICTTPDDLWEMVTLINAAKLFIGNQSLPLAIAHSLGVNRIAVLNEVDKAAYIGEEKIYSNFSYVL